jgi:glycosyltransferase involved in cell wall biosynthesis
MFDFLKYISPLYYYRLAFKMPHAVLLNDSLLEQLLAQGKLSEGKYKNRESFLMDLAYQALEAGYFPDESEKTELQNHVVRSVFDNYRFVHRFFGRKKALYVLILRLMSFHRPIREIWAFLKSKENRVQIQSVESTQFSNASFNEKVSVIIPTLNRYEYLKDVLGDLEKQSYKNFDVWVCDQSDAFDADFYKGWNLDLHLIKQEEKALWRARNRCIRESTGEYLLFFDDDSRVQPNWISEHLKCSSKTHVSTGITFSNSGKSESNKDGYYHYSNALDTGNVMIHRSIFEKTGFFDENFERMRMGDGEFGLRCLLNGFPLISNYKASRIHLKGESGGLRQMGAWDAIHNIGLFKPRPIPSSLYLAKKHFDNQTAFIYGITQLPKALVPYSLKNSSIFRRLHYYLISIFLSPILFVTFLISWKISNKLINP